MLISRYNKNTLFLQIIFVITFSISFLFSGGIVNLGEKTIIKTKIKLLEMYEENPSVNKVPNSGQENHENDLLADCESDEKPHIFLNMEINPNLDKIREKVIWSVKDSNLNLNKGNFSSSNNLKISFNPTGHNTLYDILYGVDINKNTIIDSYENLNNEEFTVRVFTPTAYNSSIDFLVKEMNSYFSLGRIVLPSAQTLLKIFLNRTDINIPYNAVEDISISASKLTHKVGADFNESGDAQIKRYIWYPEKKICTKVAESIQIAVIVNEILRSHSSEVYAHFQNSTDPFIPNWSLSSSREIEFENGIFFDEKDLYYALHRVRLVSLSISPVIIKDIDENIVVSEMNISGVMTDLYDFDYFGNILPKNAAVIQVSWNPTLNRYAGNVFEVKLNFTEQFDIWNFSY